MQAAADGHAAPTRHPGSRGPRPEAVRDPPQTIPPEQIPLYAIALPARSLGRDDGWSYFTRVNVVVLQNTAATHPDRSTAVLLLTVRVPE